jgi:hypothetical protein
VYTYNNELLVPDLGADRTCRLVKRLTDWEVEGAIEYPAGPSPRHIVVHGTPLLLTDYVLLTPLLSPRQHAIYCIGAYKRILASKVRRGPRSAYPEPCQPSRLAAALIRRPCSRQFYSAPTRSSYTSPIEMILRQKGAPSRYSERKDKVLSHARPEPSGAYEPEISIRNRM